MTVEKCVAFCKGNDYKYAGLEYYKECFCGASVNGPQANESSCNFPCTGDRTETCGSNSFMNIYQDTTFPVVDKTTIADYMPMGCYSEGSMGRSLAWKQSQLNSNAMTVESCLFACKGGGYSFGGLEFGKECYCGVVLGNGTLPLNSTSCNIPCTGNAAETCGGRSTLNLYVAKDLESTQLCNGGGGGSSSSSSVITSTATSLSSSSSQPVSITDSSTSTTPSMPIQYTSSSSSSVETTSSTSSSSIQYTSPSSSSITMISLFPPSTTSSALSSSFSSSSPPPTPSTVLSSSSSFTDTSTNEPVFTSRSSSSSSSTVDTISSFQPLTTSGSVMLSTAQTSSSFQQPTTSSSSISSSSSVQSSSSSSPSSTSTYCPPTYTSTSKSKPPPYSPPPTSSTKTSASPCTSTIITSPTPTCEYKCGSWCSKPIPAFYDYQTCFMAFSSCMVQISACFLQAGFPDSLNCLGFSNWCTSISSYCVNYCPGPNCYVGGCKSKYPPAGPVPPPPATHISVYTCLASIPTSTSLPVSTIKPSTKSCVPIPTNSNICKQPSNPWGGYDLDNPVGGIPLPCLTCNNLYNDYNSGNCFKLYVDPDTSNCPSYSRSGSHGPVQGCEDACDNQYNSCIDTYAEGCRQRKRRGSDSYGLASQKCMNQWNDCYAVNSGVSVSPGRCGSYNSGWW